MKKNQEKCIKALLYLCLLLLITYNKITNGRTFAGDSL